MRTPLRLALALAVTSLLGCGQVDQLKERYAQSESVTKAKQRVIGVLEGVKKGGADTTIDVQRAICLWYNGSAMLEMGTLSRASDLYLVWQNEGHIARHIADFEITGADDAGGGVVVVSGTIEKQPFSIKVVPGAPLSWVKAPQG
jgi:hypothetical protein